MKARYALFSILFLPVLALAQNHEPVPPGNSTSQTTVRPLDILNFVEEMPEFRGDLLSYLQKTIQYPQAAIDSGFEGRVIVSFVVDEQGHTQDPKVPRPVHPLLDSEAIRVVKAMPPWKPGKHKGKAVKVYYTLPITFRIQENDTIEEPKQNNVTTDGWKPKDQMPWFRGDIVAYLRDHTIYPEEARSDGIEGRVVVGLSMTKTVVSAILRSQDLFIRFWMRRQSGF